MSGYDTDILAWSEYQAGLLRRRAAGEIESLGKSERWKLRGLIGTVIEHLIKLQASPATDPRNEWKTSVVQARRRIQRAFKESPGLRGEVAAMILEETPAEQQDVATTLAIYGEQPRVEIGGLTFTEDQVLGDWFPDDEV